MDSACRRTECELSISNVDGKVDLVEVRYIKSLAFWK